MKNLFLFTLIFLAFIFGCKKPTPDEIIFVSLHDTVHLNQKFNIELISNNYTVYSWNWINKSAAVDSINHSRRYFYDFPDVISTETWTFNPVKKGLDTLKFAYKSITEQNIAPLESKSYIILVQ